MSTACSALYAMWVEPSFILAMRASGSVALFHSWFDPFFFRFRSIRARSSLLGVAIPLLWANSVRNASYRCPLSHRTIERIAALASSVVASTPTILPFSRPRSANTPSTHPRILPVGFNVDQPPGSRDRRMVWRSLIQTDLQKLPKPQRIGHPPRYAALRCRCPRSSRSAATGNTCPA